jgi:hypothetical protein
VENPEEKRQLGRPISRWKMGSKLVVGRLLGGVWIGFTWLRIGNGGKLL